MPRLTGDSKLVLVVSVVVWMVCEPCYGLPTCPQCIPCLCPSYAGNRLQQSPATPLGAKWGRMMDGWMSSPRALDFTLDELHAHLRSASSFFLMSILSGRDPLHASSNSWQLPDVCVAKRCNISTWTFIVNVLRVIRFEYSTWILFEKWVYSGLG